MAYLLRALLIIMTGSIFLTVFSAWGYSLTAFSHIQIAIPAFLLTIFVQAFVMFYFIGAHRLVENIWQILHNPENLNELFATPPTNLDPFKNKTKKFYYTTQLSKRQTIPWTMLMLVLGSMAFLLGGATDTGLVPGYYHSGVTYGFLAALIIGLFRQWHYLGKIHALLRKVKSLFEIPDAQM